MLSVTVLLTPLICMTGATWHTDMNPGTETGTVMLLATVRVCVQKLTPLASLSAEI